ncbi:hypothetical protein HK096_010295, partial [Nowakowskiella sp. JEL0078]
MPHQDTPFHYDVTKGYAFLFGGTRNGQVLVYGKNGVVQDRFQLHSGEITQILADSKQQILVTSGTDSTVNMHLFNVFRNEYKMITSHIRSDDHIDTITSLCSIPNLGIFVSASRDCTVK